jgi:hypothetical protein
MEEPLCACEIALKTDWNLRPGSILVSGRDAEGAPAQKLQRLITVRWMKESGVNVPDTANPVRTMLHFSVWPCYNDALVSSFGLETTHP